MNELGHIPNQRNIKILIKGQHLIIDDIINKNKYDESSNIEINNLIVYNLNNLQFILKINIPYMRYKNYEVYSIEFYKPHFFTLNNKTLGLFESDNNKLITFTTFKKNYALNKKKF